MLFGSPSITASELVSVLVAEVEPKARIMLHVADTPAHELPKPVKNKCTEWTLAVKEVLARLGSERHLEVRCNFGGKASSSEFMLDVLWCTGDSPSEGVSLACESEWEETVEQVSRDFQKLLITKAPQKLLIYTDREPTGGRVRDRIKKDMEQYPYHVEEEEYIFLGLDWQGKADAHRYTVKSSGRNLGIVLEPLEIAKSAVSSYG
jgi:hypothetical protein